MSAVPFHYVDLRAFCYATEDEKRVEAALRTFLPEDVDIEREETEGHHGDRILVLSVRLERADEVRHVLSALARLDDFQRLIDELDQRVDDNCAFFIQLDKQAAYKGDVELGTGLMLRGKVEAYPAKKEKAVETAEEALQELAEESD
ncbi:RNA-binding protein [Natronomonas gomsonensis]|jgi:RNA binding exosome subunit|uniref:RNA-binding protein n=1 Tax=Natronomonas gomsonensis TaxID=1046043 RepID=UPI0020CA71D2|nr:RNA-binding protein [Natronomonas gomsonensis]MCY4729380.1 RNA-binding protein [Natronomonas gomsonensis]